MLGKMDESATYLLCVYMVKATIGSLLMAKSIYMLARTIV